MVLLLAFSVVGAGLTLVTVQASERRILQNIASAEQADILARAGAEWLMHWVEKNADWRTGLTNGVAQAATPATGLSFSVSLTDTDGNLADNDTHSVTLTAIGQYHGATQSMSLTATPDPHPALGYAIIASGKIILDPGVSIAGPLHAVSLIDDDSGGSLSILDNASFETPPGGSIDATLQPADTEATPIVFPSPDLSFYIAQATVVNLSGRDGDRLQRLNLTPTDNTQGTPNPRGIYYVHIGSLDINIRRVHLKGTLIIKGNGGNRIQFDRAASWFEPGPDAYPTMLLDVPGGRVEFSFPNQTLDEERNNLDYNEDGDILDTFLPSVRGLVWVNAGDAELDKTAWTFQGCLVADDVYIADGVSVDDDPALAARLIPGFTDGMIHVVRGSIKEGAP